MVQENPQVEKPEVKIGDIALTPENAKRYTDGLKALEEGRLDVEGLRKGAFDLSQELQKLNKADEIAMAQQGRELSDQEKQSNRDRAEQLRQERALLKGLVDEADRRKVAA